MALFVNVLDEIGLSYERRERKLPLEKKGQIVYTREKNKVK